MIAEKASDMIKYDWNYPTETLYEYESSDDENNRNQENYDNLRSSYKLVKEVPKKWEDLDYW